MTNENDKQNINPTRKIIAISAVVVKYPADTYIIRTALCDDGTLWEKFGDTSSWEMLQPIPQPTGGTK